MAAKKSNTAFQRFTMLMLIAIGLIILSFGYHFLQLWLNGKAEFESNFKEYPSFGISLPVGFKIHGIDVSRYQDRINWSLVNSMKDQDVKIGFAIIKATEGRDYNDRQFKRNWRKSKEVGMVHGAYHYFNPDIDAAAQAQNYINTVTLAPGDLPPVLDVETMYGTNLATFQKKVLLWLQLVEQHYKVRPIVYSNAEFYNRYLHPLLQDYPLWIAHYKEKNEPRVVRKWHFWQHNEGGRVNGINAFVDFNVFKGDSTAFKSLLIGNN